MPCNDVEDNELPWLTSPLCSLHFHVNVNILDAFITVACYVQCSVIQLHGVLTTLTDNWSFKIFTVLHLMQGGLVTRKVSVRLSKACIVTKRKKTGQIFTPHERSFSLVLWEKNGWWGATPSTRNFGSSWPRCTENADFQSTFARSASAVAPIAKKFN